MARTRRSHAEVIDDLFNRLQALEKEKAKLEKDIKTMSNPLSLLATAKIWAISDAIARIVKAIRGYRKRRRK